MLNLTILQFYLFHFHISYLKDTTVILRAEKNLWPGPYKVLLDIKDQQGLSCPDGEELKLEACTCTDKKLCTAAGKGKRSAALGSAGIGLLLLGLLLLLREYASGTSPTALGTSRQAQSTMHTEHSIDASNPYGRRFDSNLCSGFVVFTSPAHDSTHGWHADRLIGVPKCPFCLYAQWAGFLGQAPGLIFTADGYVHV